MARGDPYRARAVTAEMTAADTTDAEMKRQFLDLAAQWRDLARQADDYEATIRDRAGPGPNS